MSLPEHVSHSQFTSWLRCQRAFFLERIAGAPKIPAWWLIGGSAVHEVTEHLDREALRLGLEPHHLDVTLKLEQLTREKLTELVAAEEEKSGVTTSEWDSAGRSPQGRDYWLKAAPEMVSNWLKFRSEKGWKFADLDGKPGIEWDFEVKIGDITLKGAPDRVFVLPNGQWAVIDIKSGSSTPKEPLQLGLYATVLELLGFPRPAYGLYVKVKTGQAPQPLVPLAKYDHQYFKRLFDGLRGQLNLAVETGDFLPNVGDACRTCSVRAACYAMDGALSAQWDPLDPNYEGGGANG